MTKATKSHVEPKPKAAPPVAPKPDPALAPAVKGVGPGELPDSQKTKTAQAAALTRWALVKALPVELQKEFTELPIAVALDLLSKMREACEVAAKVINQRMTEESNKTECETCHGLKRGRDWRMIKPVRDNQTGTIANIFFCCDTCIVLYNQKHQGVAAISDRGMKNGRA